jgi:hypothetical protein
VNPSAVRLTRSVEFEDELVWLEVRFNPIKKFSVIHANTFEVCGLSFGVL